MSPQTPKSLAELLGGGNLARLAGEAKSRRELTARLRDLLPPEEAAHLLSASTDETGDLVLTMDSPAWAARARYSAEALGASRVRVRVAPPRG